MILRGLIKKLYIFFIIKIGLRTAAVMVVFIFSRFLKTSWSRIINGGGTLFYEQGMFLSNVQLLIIIRREIRFCMSSLISKERMILWNKL